jgi:hypothetical protein
LSSNNKVHVANHVLKAILAAILAAHISISTSSVGADYIIHTGDFRNTMAQDPQAYRPVLPLLNESRCHRHHLLLPPALSWP